MASTYDDNLIEATKVRRTRLVEGLLFLGLRDQREWSDRLGAAVAGVFVAILACAGCVATSFVLDLLAGGGLSGRSPAAPTTRIAVGVLGGAW